MWTAFRYKSGGPPVAVEKGALAKTLRDAELLWVDLEAPTEEEARVLLEVFNFHPLAVEDAVGANLTAPKIDDFGEYLFVIVQAIASRPSASGPETIEVNLFIGKNYLVTVHLAPVPSIEAAGTYWLDSHTPTTNQSDTLAYLVIDRIVDEFLPAVEGTVEEVERLEDRALELAPAQMSRRITRLRRSLGRLHRVMSAQRDVVYRLSRPEWSLIQEKTVVYFRDVYDHTVRMETTLDALHQRADLVLQIHLGAMANKTNEVVKALSLVGTIFIPLTFLVGVWGMNFTYIPELDWRYGYLGAWAIIVIATVGMIAYFRWRHWL